jgi:hypothetical protein
VPRRHLITPPAPRPVPRRLRRLCHRARRHPARTRRHAPEQPLHRHGRMGRTGRRLAGRWLLAPTGPEPSRARGGGGDRAGGRRGRGCGGGLPEQDAGALGWEGRRVGVRLRRRCYIAWRCARTRRGWWRRQVGQVCPWPHVEVGRERGSVRIGPRRVPEARGERVGVLSERVGSCVPGQRTAHRVAGCPSADTPPRDVLRSAPACRRPESEYPARRARGWFDGTGHRRRRDVGRGSPEAPATHRESRGSTRVAHRVSVSPHMRARGRATRRRHHQDG